MFSIHILHNLQCSQTINEKYKNLSWGPHTNSNDPKNESGNPAIVLDVYTKFHRNKLLFI